jgi:EAL and modified HD-GYP domain-containing signal transduction protein
MSDVFIGRQPIFNRKLKLDAYEILARSDATNVSTVEGDEATSQVIINSLIEIGLDKIIGSHPAFFKLTRTFLLDQDLSIFPSSSTVFSIPNEIEVDEPVLEAVRRLKAAGYRIALDNFIFRDELVPLIKEADIVKVDTSRLDEEGIKKHVALVHKIGAKVLAQKVETPQQFNVYQDLGINYFQGYFFAKPSVVSSKRVPANKMTVLQLLAKVNDPNVKMDELSDLVQQDVSLSVKVLKYINSPMNGLSREIESIKQALVLLGVDMIKYWVSIMALADLETEGRPDELITTLLTRAKACELIAQKAGEDNPAAFFTVGLFSALDVMMESTMEDVLGYLPLTQEIQDALLSLKGDAGAALHAVMDMESGIVEEGAYKSLSNALMSDIYMEAMSWADDVRAQATA